MNKKENNLVKANNLIDNFNIGWSIKILILSFVLSVSFSLISDAVLTHARISLSIFIIFTLMIFGVVADMIGVAITSCNIEKFIKRKNSHNKETQACINLINNSDKISVICCDIIGDMCSILSGACGASIVYRLIVYGNEGINSVLISSCVSGFIACLTIFLKSLEKRIAVTKNEQITLIVAKCIKRVKK